MWPDKRYVASDGGNVKTGDNFPIARRAKRRPVLIAEPEACFAA